MRPHLDAFTAGSHARQVAQPTGGVGLALRSVFAAPPDSGFALDLLDRIEASDRTFRMPSQARPD